MFPKVTILGLFTLLCIEQISSLYPQYSMFFLDNPVGCHGLDYDYTFDNNNYTHFFQSDQLSIKTRGAWLYKITLKKVSMFMYSADADGSTCTTFFINNQDTKVFARKLLNTELEESGITLVQDLVNWDSVISSTASELSLASAENFQVLAITGLESYTLYSQVDYKGDAYCIDVGDISEGYKLTSPALELIGITTIGSFRRGCEENGENVKHFKSPSKHKVLFSGDVIKYETSTMQLNEKNQIFVQKSI